MGGKTPAALLQALEMVRGSEEPTIEALGAVESKHVSRVRKAFEDPNIVAVGIAEKITERKATGELCLCFYVEKKLPKSRTNANKMVPPVMAVPDGSAVFTDVQEIGRVRPQVNRRATPIKSGFSVGHFKTTAGTVGAIVQKGKSLFILSNSHVLALSGKAKVGDAVTYPGSADRDGKARQDVAQLADFVPFEATDELVNLVDAALARIDGGWREKVDMSILKAAVPLKVMDPERGMKIVKRGRTSGDTTGVINDVHFSIVLPYPGVGKVGFADQAFCTRYSEPGDSGSIIVDQKSGKIVGLHFAGSSRGSVFNPIKAVMKALKFRFVDA